VVKTLRKVPGSIPGVAGIFTVTSDWSMCPGADRASKREYQDIPGGKGGRCVRLTTYHLHVPIVKKSGGLNLLEPRGPVQVCNGRALPLTLCASKVENNKVELCGYLASSSWLQLIKKCEGWLLKFCRTVCGEDVNVFVVLNCLVAQDDKFRVPLISFVGAPAKLGKSDFQLRHVCPSVRMEQSGSYWSDYNEICYWNIFRKSVEKIQIPLKSDKNYENFTWRPVLMYEHISLKSYQNEK